MTGKVEWIGIRPERKARVVSKESVSVNSESGIEGDHPTVAHRQLTIISKEQLETLRILLDKANIDPAATRRNILISGLDFDKLENATLQIGSVTVEITGPCHPCQRMEDNLGKGGRQAMQNLGGWMTRVLESGTLSVGDQVSAIVASTSGLAEH
jgi:MOSC domain-containing protein YiiM